MMTMLLRSAPAHRATCSPTGPAGVAISQRDPLVALALARLEHADLHRDPAAAARVLDELGASDAGAWLLHQMAAAGLRALATTAQTLTPAGGPA